MSGVSAEGRPPITLRRCWAGLTDGLDAPARARWPLDPKAETARGAGVKA
jgi:N6-L-threonylcarbamoyladenine synthase